MSTKKHTPLKPQKPKQVNKTTTPELAPTMVEETPKTVSAPTTEVPAPTVEGHADGKRQNLSKALKIEISAARIRRHLDRLNLNRVAEEHLSVLKSETSAYEEAKRLLTAGGRTKTEEYTEEVTKDDGSKEQVKNTRDLFVPLTEEEKKQFQATVDKVAPRMEELTNKITALSRDRVRFASDAPVTLAIIANKLISQMMNHAMTVVLANKKKIVQIPHLYAAGVEKLSLYPLIKSLPSFVKTADELSSAARQAELKNAVAEAREQALKEFKKQYADVLPKKKKGTTPAVPPVVAPTTTEPTHEEPAVEEKETSSDDDEADGKTTFKFYVSLVCKEVIKSNLAYTHVRISTDIRNYLSNLLIELIQRLSGLILLTTEAMKIKTVNDVAIMKTVEKIMIDGHTPTETIVFREEQVPKPEAVKLELEAKEKAKQEGREYKIDYSKLPHGPGFVASRTITYETSGFSQLAAEVAEKLKVYKDYMKEPKAVKAE